MRLKGSLPRAWRDVPDLISRAGAVSFELDLCTMGVCAERPTLSLRGCKLEAGGRVMPRKVSAAPGDGGLGTPGAMSIIVALLAVASCVRLMWKQSRHNVKP